MSDQITRTVNGTNVPLPGTYALDLSHSHIGFTVRHLMVAKVRGSFNEFAGTIEIAEDPLASSVSVDIELASIDTRDEQRDGHLRSADFFDTENHPKMTFRSTAVRPAKGDRYEVDGDLTVLGTTAPVTLEVEFEGAAKDPWGGTRIGFSATTEIDRESFGLTYNQALETGGVLIGKKATITIEAEAVLQ